MKPYSSKSKLAVDSASGKWGIADETGNWIISPEFDKIEPGDFSKTFKVENYKFYGQINIKGGWIIGPFLKMPSARGNVIDEDCCLACGNVPVADSQYETLTFSLSANGVLTISGEGVVRGVNDVDVVYYPSNDEEDVEINVRSAFKNLDFHTVIIKDGVVGLGKDCFSGCKNLKRIILPSTLEFAHSNIARDTDLDFLEEDGLLYLGQEDNPHFILLKTSTPYEGKPVSIPGDVHIVALGAFNYNGNQQTNESAKDYNGEEDLPF